MRLSHPCIQVDPAHAKALSMVVSLMMSTALSGAASDAMHSLNPISSSMLVRKALWYAYMQ